MAGNGVQRGRGRAWRTHWPGHEAIGDRMRHSGAPGRAGNVECNGQVEVVKSGDSGLDSQVTLGKSRETWLKRSGCTGEKWGKVS